MARLFADENFPLPVVEALRDLGHDVVTTAEAGVGGRGVPDDAILQLATDQSRVVLTLNRRHFVRLHLDRPDHAGIVVCTFNVDFVEQAGQISAVLDSVTEHHRQLMRVNRPGPATPRPA